MIICVTIRECGTKEVVAEDVAYVNARLESPRSDAQMNAVFELRHYTTEIIYSTEFV